MTGNTELKWFFPPSLFDLAPLFLSLSLVWGEGQEETQGVLMIGERLRSRKISLARRGPS